MGGLFEITLWLKKRKVSKRAASDLLGGCFLDHFGDPLAAEVAEKTVSGTSFLFVRFSVSKRGGARR